jgi:hypothetical protein
MRMDRQDRTFPLGRAMTHAVNRRPLAAEAGVRTHVSLCGICRQSDTGAGFSPRSSVFHCQRYSTVALHADISGGRSSET